LSVPAERGSGVSQRGKKKDRHDGRPIIILWRNKERESEEEEVSAGNPLFFDDGI